MRVELQTLHTNVEGLGNAARTWETRSSLRLFLDDGAGHVGLGEAAPLPGLSPESARDARRALDAVEWPEVAPLEFEDIAKVVETIPADLPSARFAAESALLTLAASIRGIPLWAMWTDEVEELPLAMALWGRDEVAVGVAARAAAACEVTAVKVKVGRLSTRQDVELIRHVREIVGPIELRLDANGSFEPDRLLMRLESLAPFAPAFLEEPCDLERVLALASTPYPLAVDESLIGEDAEATLARALTCPHIGAVVLKPTLLGGLTRCHRLAKTAQAAGREAIVSHALEGTIARAGAAHLALVLGGGAAGLGDHPALSLLSDGLVANWIDLARIRPPTLPGLSLELSW